ncbi:MAG: carbohydrate kinase [Bacteroides sp. SM23_62_1]|nr:MAG: carbohydrate kinase [Bacteroides sp. SM23_62_1]
MKDYILSVDQSTSATKAILVNKKGKIRDQVSLGHQQYYPQPDWVEHDPVEIYQNTVKAITQIINKSGLKQDDIAALAITNQRETVVVWDRVTATPIYPAVVWQCQRGAAICKELREKGYEPMIQSSTGLIIDPYFSASGIKWILDNVEGAMQKARNGDLLMGTIDSWLLWKLSGGRVHATDYSNACRTMLFNIHTCTWDKDIADLLGIPMSMYPEVKYSDEVFGYSQPSPDFDFSLPVSGILGDSHAALFGQNCFSKGMGKATYGTGSSIMMNIGDQPLDCPEGLVTSIGWGAQGKIVYVFEGNIHCTGDTINWLVNDIGLINDPGSSEQIALSVPDNNGVYLVPAFVGLGAPYWDNDARAIISGMPRSTGKAHLVRAALEAIAYQVKDLVDLMTTGSGVSLVELRVDGGPTRNRFLMQFQADMLNASINRSDIAEVSALGSAYMAGLSTGLWKDLEEIKSLRGKDEIFKGKMPEVQRDKLYNGWKKAVERTLL